MSVDLTQFAEGDSVIATLRGSIRPGFDGNLGLQIEPDNGGQIIPLSQLIRATHVAPEIQQGKYYIDADENLFIGLSDGRLRGPINSTNITTFGPSEIAMIRSLRAAEVRPVIPA